MGGFLPVVVGIKGADGERLDRPDVNGDHAPIMLKLGDGLSGVSGTPGPGGITEIQLGATSTIAFDTHAEFRAVDPSSLVDGEVITFKSPPGSYVYFANDGAGFVDDDETILKPDDIDVSLPGRAYPANPSSVVATWAALGLATSGKQASIQMQAYSAIGDGGGDIFDYDPNDTTTADDGGTVRVAGARRLKRRYVGRVNAKWFGAKGDGVTHDDTAFQKAHAAALSGSGHLHIPEGHYVLATKWVINPRVTIHGSPQTTIESNASLGGISGCIEYQNQAVASGVLQADVVPGSRATATNPAVDPVATAQFIHVTMSFGAVPVAGQEVAVIFADTNTIYDITHVDLIAGAHYKLTVDRPAYAAWPVGTAINTFAALPHEIHFHGNGATFLANPTVLTPGILISGTRGAHISGLTMIANANVTAGFVFDGCQQSSFEDCSVDMTATTSATGFQLEGCERCVGKNLTCIGGAFGFYLSDSYQSGFEDCWSFYCTAGAMFVSTLGAAAMQFGCFDCWVTGGGDIGCVQGLSLFGCTRTVAEGYKSSYAANFGILVTLAAGFLAVPTVDNIIRDCSGTDAAYAGCLVEVGVTGTKLEMIDVSGSGIGPSGLAGLQIKSPTTVNGVIAHRMTAPAAIDIRSLARVEGIDVDFASSTGRYGVSVNNGGLRCDLSGRVAMTATTASIGLGTTTSVVNASGFVVTGAQIGAQIDGTSSFRIDADCDFSGCTIQKQTAVGSKIRTIKETRIVQNTGSSSPNTVYPKEDAFEIGRVQTTLSASPEILMTYDGPYPTNGTVQVWIDLDIVDETTGVFDSITVRGIVKVSGGVLTIADAGTVVAAYKTSTFALAPVLSIVSSKIVISTAQNANKTIDWAGFIKFRTLDLA